MSRSCNEGISSADVISKLNWGRIHFCAQLVVIGKTSSLAGSWTQGLCSSLAVGQRLLQFLVLCCVDTVIIILNIDCLIYKAIMIVLDIL